MPERVHEIRNLKRSYVKVIVLTVIQAQKMNEGSPLVSIEFEKFLSDACRLKFLIAEKTAI